MVTGDAEASLPIPAFETLTEAPETSTMSGGEGWLPPERGDVQRDGGAWGGRVLQKRGVLLVMVPLPLETPRSGRQGAVWEAECMQVAVWLKQALSLSGWAV